jgi:hypothetical protein
MSDCVQYRRADNAKQRAAIKAELQSLSQPKSE